MIRRVSDCKCANEGADWFEVILTTEDEVGIRRSGFRATHEELDRRDSGIDE